MIIYPPEPQSGLHITGLRSVYVRGQMIIKGGGGSRGVIQRQAGSETARSSRLTSGSNLNLTTRSAVFISIWSPAATQTPNRLQNNRSLSARLTVYIQTALSDLQLFYILSFPSRSLWLSLCYTNIWPPSLSSFLISEAQSWCVFLSVWVQPVSQTSVLSVFPHLALSPAVLISVLPLNIAYVQSYSHWQDIKSVENTAIHWSV